MINNRKVRLMTRLAMYEESEGKEDIRINTYFKRDFVRAELLKTLIYVTIGYFLIVGMYFGYRLEFLVQEAVHLDYAAIVTKVMVIYLIVLAVYGITIWLIYTLYYGASRKKLAKYFRMLRKLRSYYNEQEEGIITEEEE